MPYIKSDDYTRAAVEPITPGELNYAITLQAIKVLEGHLGLIQFVLAVDKLISGYFKRVGMSYTNGNAVMGVLDCAARELNRRVPPSVGWSTDVFMLYSFLNNMRDDLYDTRLAPYEDTKIEENGDVYPDMLTNG
jgi:hypothetical protein